MNLGELIEQLRRVGDQFNSWYLVDTNVESLELINDTIVVKLKKESFDAEEFDRLVYLEADRYCKESNCGHIMPNDWEIAHDCIKIGYLKAMEEMK